MNHYRFFFIISIFSLNVFAHGENKLGPHQGFVRMPGNFHTELVKDNDQSFNIYLMDVGNKNPLVKNSTVQLSYRLKSQLTIFNCQTRTDHFNCKTNQKINLNQGQFILSAIRNDQKGSDAIYNLPLKLTSLPGDISDTKH